MTYTSEDIKDVKDALSLALGYFLVMEKEADNFEVRIDQELVDQLVESALEFKAAMSKREQGLRIVREALKGSAAAVSALDG